jgi:hypothetical protein
MGVSVMRDTKLKRFFITSHKHRVPRGTGTPEGRDKVNRRDVFEY